MDGRTSYKGKNYLLHKQLLMTRYQSIEFIVTRQSEQQL